MTQLYPVVNDSFLYIKGFEVAWGSTSTLTVSSGQCRDSNNIIDMSTDSTLTITDSNSGALGLDTGSMASSTWYYVYVIGDSTGNKTTSVLLSASQTQPTLPTGYDSFRRISQWYNDGGGDLFKGYQSGSGNLRKHWHDGIISVLSAGAAQTLTAFSLTAAVPPITNSTYIPCYLYAQFTPASADDTVKFAVFGSIATSLPLVSGSVASKVSTSLVTQFAVLDSSVPKILYINSAAACATTVHCQGYEFEV